jgi:hypothetical protein
MQAIRPLLATLLTLLLSMACGSRTLSSQAVAQVESQQQSAAGTERAGREIQRLVQELNHGFGTGAMSSAELQRRIGGLREALASYTAELGADGSASIPAQRTTRPIAPKTLGRSELSQRPEVDPKAQEESLRGTHLAPSPDEMRARAQAGASSRKRDAVNQMKGLLSEVEGIVARDPAADQQMLKSIAQRLEALSAILTEE